ncbi:MAG: hypothetical protein IJ737_06780 [Ruminococcus sp.]|nr:hypothetical protein [Ruminococcus sp.]
MTRKPFAVLAAALMLAGCSLPGERRRNESLSPEYTEPVAPEVTDVPEETTTAPPPETTLVTTSTGLAQETYEFAGNCILANKGTPLVRAMEQYYYSDYIGQYLADSVNAFADSIGDKVNIYLMCIPSSEEFYAPDAIRKQYADQYDSTLDIYSKLYSAQGVFLNDFFEEHKAEYLYSRTDYHWQPLAAFYAARIFAEQAEVPFAEYDTYERVDIENYLGAFYNVNGIYELGKYPDTFTYYKPSNLKDCTFVYHDTYFSPGQEDVLFFEWMDVPSSYLMVGGADDVIIEAVTNVDNDRILVIFKDSYGNALLPFLTHSFSRIYVCDNRYFDINSIDFCKEVHATDVLFALGTATYTSEDKVYDINGNRYQ